MGAKKDQNMMGTEPCPENPPILIWKRIGTIKIIIKKG
jgi:hypothetical protein